MTILDKQVETMTENELRLIADDIRRNKPRALNDAQVRALFRLRQLDQSRAQNTRLS